MSSAPLSPELWRDRVRDDRCGGYATFEGWVRNTNEGLDVRRLEYQAYERLANKEGQRIMAEAAEKFALVHAVCVHRTGELEIGDTAVWVAVSAGHRDAAFRACRYIIDEVKLRVPIWKKEYYVNGDSGWVNCEACAHPHTGTHDHR
ncbi:MAG: molybdenum cofactor biosynthesis protein MoaE [Gammaproteobacteria bacterium]|nr:molybdenum cofactor biosynthesis protein MoaE [Gammaproteobacteria bacterium]